MDLLLLVVSFCGFIELEYAEMLLNIRRLLLWIIWRFYAFLLILENIIFRFTFGKLILSLNYYINSCYSIFLLY